MKSKRSSSVLQITRAHQDEIREFVSFQMRSAALSLVHSLFQQEVQSLCGALFQHKRGQLYHRGGSEKGSVILQGRRLCVRRPRVRNFSNKEVRLSSYQALQDFDLLCERVLSHLLRGVSTRNYEPLLEEWSEGLGLKKSAVSRAFRRGSQKALEELNGRELKVYDIVSLMIDGLEFAGQMVICVLGIRRDGQKMILGLRQGDTENSEVCVDLLQSLVERGFKVRMSSLLFTIDGSRALRKAILKVFGKKVLVQRCVRHKERNIEAYLPRGFHQEFRRRWKLLHGSVNYREAEREYEVLRSWLGRINLEARNSLDEAKKETLTMIKLKCPGLLRKTLMSTNPIESAFSFVREKSRRVKNWKRSSDQAVRWSAVTLLEAEKTFRTIKGFREISDFVEELERQCLKPSFEKGKAAG